MSHRRWATAGPCSGVGYSAAQRRLPTHEAFGNSRSATARYLSLDPGSALRDRSVPIAPWVARARWTARYRVGIGSSRSATARYLSLDRGFLVEDHPSAWVTDTKLERSHKHPTHEAMPRKLGEEMAAAFAREAHPLCWPQARQAIPQCIPYRTTQPTRCSLTVGILLGLPQEIATPPRRHRRRRRAESQ
jgi:hypothetical protein